MHKLSKQTDGEMMMSERADGIDLREKLSRLARMEGAGVKDEPALVTATGAMPPAWMIKILGRDSFNLYDVQLVNIAVPGVDPVPVSSNIQAYNAAESFTVSGSVATGTYAVMWRVSGQNVFYVKP